MNYQTDWRTVPMPEAIAKLPRDSRGYPVPVIVAKGEDGKPLFAVNHGARVLRCALKKLCAICGERLKKELWFTGGPQSAFDIHGCYADTAMHHECMQYAMRVCPYLATVNQSRLKDTNLDKISAKLGGAMVVDHTMDPGKPIPFVCVMAYGQSIFQSGKSPEGIYVRPLRPYHAVEYWHAGSQVDEMDAMQLLMDNRKLDPAEVSKALRLIHDRVKGKHASVR